MDLKPGSRWQSAVCDTEVVVVRAPAVRAALYSISSEGCRRVPTSGDGERTPRSRPARPSRPAVRGGGGSSFAGQARELSLT